MLKLIMTRGLPASGKTTRAKEQIKDGKFKRINKDEIRAMLDNGRRSKFNEKIVIQIRDSIIIKCLSDGISVIVDDTNYAPVHEEVFKHIAKSYGAVFKIQEFGTPVQECVKRDAMRLNPVGAKVIRQMYNQYVGKGFQELPVDENLPTCIICDIDGTIANHVARGPFDMELLETDEPIKAVAYILKNISSTIVFMSGRENKYRERTIERLNKHNIPIDELYMRQTDDNRPDTIIKKELYDKYIKGQYNVLFAIDDRNRITDQWRELGIFTFDVNQTREDF